jgi:hypothetical protein
MVLDSLCAVQLLVLSLPSSVIQIKLRISSHEQVCWNDA